MLPRRTSAANGNASPHASGIHFEIHGKEKFQLLKFGYGGIIDFMYSDLNSSEEKISGQTWTNAYPLLWEAGMRVALIRLAGQDHQSDREDAVSAALSPIVRSVLEKNQRATIKFKPSICWT